METSRNETDKQRGNTKGDQGKPCPQDAYVPAAKMRHRHSRDHRRMVTVRPRPLELCV